MWKKFRIHWTIALIFALLVNTSSGLASYSENSIVNSIEGIDIYEEGITVESLLSIEEEITDSASMLNEASDAENNSIEEEEAASQSSSEMETSLREKVEAAVQAASPVVVTTHYSMDWAVIGLARSGNEALIPTNYLTDRVAYLKDPANNTLFFQRPTEFQRTTLGILAAGGDPTNIGGYNLIKQIYKANFESQGLNAFMFGLLAFDSGDYYIPSDAKWTREKIIEKILAAECESGGWNLGMTGGGNGDPDMTGMAMTALAPYNNEQYPEVQEAIARAVDYLSSIQHASGGYQSWGSLNSESCAQVIMGLTTNGIDPTSEKFTKNGKNIVDALLSFEVSEGGFAHTEFRDELTVNGMATEQALYALNQYIYFLDNKGLIYQWGEQDVSEFGTVNVRIEGSGNQLIANVSVAIGSKQFSIKDAVKQALTVNEIAYEENSTGFQSIDGIAANIANGEQWLASVENGVLIKDLSARYISNTEAVVVFLGEDHADYSYAWLEIPFTNRGLNASVFNVQEVTVYTGVDISLTATGYSLGEESVPVKIADADVYINGNPYLLEEEQIVTNDNGELTVTFSEAGNYEIIIAKEGVRSAHFLVRAVDDVEPPTATISAQIKDEINIDIIPVFYITPSDNKDASSEITMSVSLNDEKLEPTAVNANGRHEFRNTNFSTTGLNILAIVVTDKSGNSATITREIGYKPSNLEISDSIQQDVTVPSSNAMDHQIDISTMELLEKLTITIPTNKTSKVLLQLPESRDLPEIAIEKGKLTVTFAQGISIEEGESRTFELFTAVSSTDSELNSELSDQLRTVNKELEKIHTAFIIGGSEKIKFSDEVTFTASGMKGAAAAYIDESGILHLIEKFATDEDGKNSGKAEYSYDSSEDLVIRTNHFTTFVIFETKDVDVPGGGTDPPATETATISVDKLTINKGYVIDPINVTLQSGDTAWSVLERILEQRGIDYRYQYYEQFDSVYVQSIDGDGEFDHGSGSGWMYNVNGVYPNYGASKYILNNGDKVEWRYTANLGADLGVDMGNWENGNGEKSPVEDEEVTQAEQELAKRYSDANKISTWAKVAVQRGTDKGFIAGYNGRFQPKELVTRAEFIKLIIASLQLPLSDKTSSDFSDVTETDWFYPYVNTAYEAGIVTGYNNSFSPNNPISREEMAIIVIRALEIEAEQGTTLIKDIANVAAWASLEVQTAVELELMMGYNQLFKPKDFVTREMAAVVVLRMYDYNTNNNQQ